MLSGSCFGEEGVEGIISSSYCLVNWHLTIRLCRLQQCKKIASAGIVPNRIKFVKLIARTSVLAAKYLNTMLKTEKLPARVSNLNAGLTNVDTNALSHAGRYSNSKSFFS